MKVQEKELNTPHGILKYVIAGGEAQITGYRGRDTEVVIPAAVEGCAVTHIGKKAFLSNKMLKQISLPKSVVRIDDWAFAYCAALSKVTLPYHRMEIGQGIFKDCSRLEQIVDERADEQESKTADIAYLLAAVMSKLDAFYLFDFENAGTAEWIVQWDSRMQSVMDTEDAEGFSKMLLCGEEDYGSKENDLGHYTEQRRREKVRLAILRMMHDYGLEDSVREKLKEYLLAHVKGQPTEETWLVVLEEYGDDLAYYRFLTQLGGVREDNFQAMMEDMGESHTEMKAYLMKYHSEHHVKEDAFAMFEL
ncbi:MAG: leucine-rich repeat domain-containing protein [Eubacterium sp.]|nr:leucine-rich repeat domain-containing protein [Eubacterium sp.]